MAPMTLADLKAENEAEEAKLSETENAETETTGDSPPQADELETETEAATDETEETSNEVETNDEETAEIADWMKSEDEPQEGEKPKLFTSDQVRAARIKGQEKGARRSNDEIDQLKAQINELKQGSTAPLTKPKREDFYEADDPDTAYDDAVMDYTLNIVRSESAANNATSNIEQKQNNRANDISQAADAHYERAIELAQKSGIKASDYQKADENVREMINELYPDSGDKVTDELISIVGKGSEKTFYNIGVNKARLSELRTHLQNDPSALSAVAYLSGINATLSSQSKRKTNAPAPPDDVKGDKKTNSNLKALQKKYTEMQNKGDVNGAYNLKRNARKEGVDTKGW